MRLADDDDEDERHRIPPKYKLCCIKPEQITHQKLTKIRRLFITQNDIKHSPCRS